MPLAVSSDGHYGGIWRSRSHLPAIGTTIIDQRRRRGARQSARERSSAGFLLTLGRCPSRYASTRVLRYKDDAYEDGVGCPVCSRPVTALKFAPTTVERRVETQRLRDRQYAFPSPASIGCSISRYSPRGWCIFTRTFFLLSRFERPPWIHDVAGGTTPTRVSKTRALMQAALRKRLRNPGAERAAQRRRVMQNREIAGANTHIHKLISSLPS